MGMGLAGSGRISNLDTCRSTGWKVERARTHGEQQGNISADEGMEKVKEWGGGIKPQLIGTDNSTVITRGNGGGRGRRG